MDRRSGEKVNAQAAPGSRTGKIRRRSRHLADVSLHLFHADLLLHPQAHALVVLSQEPSFHEAPLCVYPDRDFRRDAHHSGVQVQPPPLRRKPPHGDEPRHSRNSVLLSIGHGAPDLVSPLRLVCLSADRLRLAGGAVLAACGIYLRQSSGQEDLRAAGRGRNCRLYRRQLRARIPLQNPEHGHEAAYSCGNLLCPHSARPDSLALPAPGGRRTRSRAQTRRVPRPAGGSSAPGLWLAPSRAHGPAGLPDLDRFADSGMAGQQRPGPFVSGPGTRQRELDRPVLGPFLFLDQHPWHYAPVDSDRLRCKPAGNRGGDRLSSGRVVVGLDRRVPGPVAVYHGARARQ